MMLAQTMISDVFLLSKVSLDRGELLSPISQANLGFPLVNKNTIPKWVRRVEAWGSLTSIVV